MRRLINDPYDVVEEMLSGYVKAHSDYVKLLEHQEKSVSSSGAAQVTNLYFWAM